MGIKSINPRAEGQWVTVHGNIDATGWTGQTAFGPRTVTEGGAIKIGGGKSIDGFIGTDISDAVSAAGGVTARKLSTGVQPGPQYILVNCISHQTTVAHHFTTPPQILNPQMTLSGNFVSEASPGATDLGSGDSTSSYRLSPNPGANLFWRAAEGLTTDATDLLAFPLTALGGDITFPWNVPNACKGLVGMGIGKASDAAGAGMTVGEYRMQGQGLKLNPQDFGGIGVGGEAAATSSAATIAAYWDDMLGVVPGSAIDLITGYTGTDEGSQTLAMAIVAQL